METTLDKYIKHNSNCKVGNTLKVYKTRNKGDYPKLCAKGVELALKSFNGEPMKFQTIENGVLLTVEIKNV